MGSETHYVSVFFFRPYSKDIWTTITMLAKKNRLIIGHSFIGLFHVSEHLDNFNAIQNFPEKRVFLF